VGEPIVGRRVPVLALDQSQDSVRVPTAAAAGGRQGVTRRQLKGRARARRQRRSEFGNQGIKIGIASRRYCREMVMAVSLLIR